ncbi:MAG TPA: ABC transporter permease, partial [Crenalkalicoccus sp.]|nr:ABC transporter permease [Crenalkalicoccus sp.]
AVPEDGGGMGAAETLRTALASLAANPLRAALTALGILVGVAAVVATVAVAEGAREQVLAQIRLLGANLLVVWPGSVTQGGARLGAGQRQDLSWEDARVVARELPRFRLAAGVIRGPQQVVGGNRNWATRFTGADPEFFAAQDWPVVEGRLYTEEENEGARKVALLGATVAETLFGGESPLGREIRVRTTRFEVVGVLARKGEGTQGQDLDDVVFVPFWTARRSVMGAPRANAQAVDWIVAKVHEGEDMGAAEEDLRALMRQRHRVAAHEEDDVAVRNVADIAAARDASARTLAGLLASTAAVSLLVGGIGVMNIMLVGVTERTREIGLRLALGARRRDVLAQILAEAVVLALLGGAAGVAAGIGLSHALAGLAGWPVLIRADAVALALGVSALTGLCSGVWPARRAARLDPVVALRRE